MEEQALFPVELPHSEPFRAGWGDWCIGDLSDALRTATELLGPTAPVGWVALYPPAGGDHLPVVQVAVPDKQALNTVVDQLASDRCRRMFLDDPSERTVEVEADGVIVHLWTAR